jgi:hypothetical protein
MFKSLAIVTALIVTLTTVAWAAQQEPKSVLRPSSLRPSSTKDEVTKDEMTISGVDAITIPSLLNDQGRLLDATGKAVPDTTYSVQFALYVVATGGSSFWSETQTIRTKSGLFAALLGSVAPIESVPQAGTCYLGMKVGADPEMTPRVQIASAAYAYIARKADTANYAIASSGGDNAWVRVGSDSVLYTIRQLGVARGGAGNSLYGTNSYTHTNLGSSSRTGTSGLNSDFCTVSGGESNVACSSFATVGGGQGNTAGDQYATVSGGIGDTARGLAACIDGGIENVASSAVATVSGGEANSARDTLAYVGGGIGNAASAVCATVGGGRLNQATSYGSTVSGGIGNTASEAEGATVAGGDSNWSDDQGATVSGGSQNVAFDAYSAVGGGYGNEAYVSYATIPGGYDDSVTAEYGFAAGDHSVVPEGIYMNSAAFNGQTATASNQLRCGALSKTGGSFTIDDPIDPQNKILNHYFVESPDMSNLYSGSVVLDGSGRAEVQLPDYFDALNRNPHVQLTGVGSPDVVYVAEDISGNQFVIGGKPGMKVYWQVTGDRKDPSAEIIRDMMPVEQPKTGALAGRSLDDDFLVGCMQQLEQMGKAGEFSFRTAGGRQRYEDMLKRLQEAQQHKNALPAQPREERKQSELPSRPLQLQP